MKKVCLFLIFVFVLQFSARADALSLELTSDGGGVYTLRGVDFANVGGVQLEILYDDTTLQSPRVTKGALLFPTNFTPPNTQYPPSIKIAAASTSPINGTGVLATIKFTPVGATPGPVFIKTSKLTTIPALGVTTIPHTIKNPADFTAEKATKDAEAARLAAEKAAKDAENARLAAELSAKDAEDKRLAAEKAEKDKADADKAAKDKEAIDKAAKDAEDKRLAAEKAAKDAEDKRLAAVKAARDAEDAKAKAASASATAVLAQSKASGASVVGGVSIGSITLPADQLASSDRKTEYQPLVTDLRGDMTIPLSGSTPQTAGVQKPGKEKQQEKSSVTYKSVLQLFREFKGEKNAKELISLFAEGAVPNFTQDPPVALSDGITPVRLTLTLKPGGNDAPKFLLQGASVKQLSSEGGEQVVWTIIAVPKKGVYESSLTVVDGLNIMEIPLVVTSKIGPLAPKAEKFTEADFTYYLSKPAKFDLNKDEKFNSIDDYIYTANYIVAMKIKPEKMKKDESKPGQKDDANKKEPKSTKEDKSKKVPTP